MGARGVANRSVPLVGIACLAIGATIVGVDSRATAQQQGRRQDPTPQREVFIDEGACPGEGCGYGRWEVFRPTELRQAPRLDAPVVHTLKRREMVTALTGAVHTVPGRFVVQREHESDGRRYRIGDVLRVYTYLGEGWFKVAIRGERYEEDLGFSPWGGTAGARCERNSDWCWGELDEELDMTWWIRIATDDGVTGWTNEASNFNSLSRRAEVQHYWGRRLRNEAPMEDGELRSFLAAAQEEFANKAFRIYGGFGGGELQTDRDGAIRYRRQRLVDQRGNERYEIEEYTNEPTKKCPGYEAVEFLPPVGPETVLKIVWRNDNGRWSATGRPGYREEARGDSLLPWLNPDQPLDDAGLRVIRGRPARGVRYRYELPERAQLAPGEQEFPITKQVLWFDVETLLPARWGGEIDDPALRQQLLEGTGYEDYGYFFEYDDELDLTPPPQIERPDCVGGGLSPRR